MLAFVLAALILAGGPQLHEMERPEVERYVEEVADATPDFASRLKLVIERSVGTPYHDGPLGEGPSGTHDKDPLVDLTRVDCVTYVEQSLALASAPSYEKAVENLQRIRYRNGKIDYESRNHFMISDWIANNPYCVDVTQKLETPTETVTRTISRKDFFKLLKADEVGQDTPDQDVTLCYVPAARTAEAAGALPDLALVVFIGKVDWLFSLHCGVYVRDEAGEGKLYHASSKAGKVVPVSLEDYVESQAGRYIGFTAYAITEPKFFE